MSSLEQLLDSAKQAKREREGGSTLAHHFAHVSGMAEITFLPHPTSMYSNTFAYL